MRHLLFAIAIVLGAPPAMACSIMPSELSWEERLREQKVIFIGTVRKSCPRLICRSRSGITHSDSLRKALVM